MVCQRLRIYGIVQGVFFRASMQEKARCLGITGWVRNREDSTVEAVVQGTADAIEEIIVWAKIGPAQAQVERVEQESVDPENFTEFDQRPSA